MLQHHSVRKSYDTVAEQYGTASATSWLTSRSTGPCWPASPSRPAIGAPIADLGCGPGHIAAWLAGQGVAPVGIDLSPAMIAVGRRDHPNAEFRRGISSREGSSSTDHQRDPA